jgi:hypothetical protein
VRDGRLLWKYADYPYGTLELGSPDHVAPYRIALHGTAQLAPIRRKMKKNKELNAIISQLDALVARSDVDPDQKKHVRDALDELKWLRHKTKCTQQEMFYCVRKVAESLLNAFRQD